ncbi:hypothetical protein FPOAC1_001760 [Fusarium poae]|uniref:hypothetical protein n=1 Tax=Fusarium poae TaxID=36050 RepID=UPI001CEBF052|nr:hypothetical protein FPOAC1_001760 [Fusarium poae]KAG8675767.1 hypothetical protein FPOAC1_001760 [Fusarium poae]
MTELPEYDIFFCCPTSTRSSCSDASDWICWEPCHKGPEQSPKLSYFWIPKTAAVSLIVPLVNVRLPSLSVAYCKRRMHCSEQNGASMCIRPRIGSYAERDNPVNNRQERHMVLPKYWGFGGREHRGRRAGQSLATFATKNKRFWAVLVNEVDDNLLYFRGAANLGSQGKRHSGKFVNRPITVDIVYAEPFLLGRLVKK